MSGHVRAAVHSKEVPRRALATEYVATPDGSSSAAPVMIPGAIAEKKRRTGLRVGSPSVAVRVGVVISHSDDSDRQEAYAVRTKIRSTSVTNFCGAKLLTPSA